MKKMKQEKGITLIALVITIIVLLILAGVAISMLSGENGILRQAANAKTKMEIAAQDEKLVLDEMEFIIGSQGEPWKEDVAESFGGGEGTDTNPYLIYNAEQLTYLAQQANQGETYEGKYIKIMNDIDLKYRKFNPIAIGYKEEIQPGIYDFTKNVFQGNIDGQGYTIKGININEPQINGVGIIGVLGEKATVNNLNIGVGKIIANTCAGGIAGSSKGNITNCSNSAQIILKSNGQTISSQLAGGIVGWSFAGIIENCNNYGEISAEYIKELDSSGLAVGGIVGFIQSDLSKIIGCTNKGNVNAGNYAAGGIVGYIYESTANVSDCYNIGKVSAESWGAGGIVGYLESSNSSKVMGCTNKANIATGIWGAGGIVGRLDSGNIEKCSNEGEKVTTTKEVAGGIVGFIGSDSSRVSECTNKASITTGTWGAGGIAGRVIGRKS